MSEKIKKIDTHVHFRDRGEAYKETIKGGLKKAAAQGIIAVCDMPNKKPLTLYEEDVLLLLRLAKKAKSKVKYLVWVGITTDEKQIEEAVRLVRTTPEVVGIKLYAGPSTGNLGITTEEELRKIFKTLVELDYEGVLAVHCEEKSELRENLWDPQKPETFGKVRPIAAEVKSVKKVL